MPLISFLKKLVVAEDTQQQQQEQQEQQEQQQQEQQPIATVNGDSDTKKTIPPPPLTPNATASSEGSPKPPLPPPPPKGNLHTLASTHSTSSIASLRSQVEEERRTASSASVYTDFTGGGHADAGHWNDPPTIVFKPHALAKKKTMTHSASAAAVLDHSSSNASAGVGADTGDASEASSFIMVEGSATPSGMLSADASPKNTGEADGEADGEESKGEADSLTGLPEGRDEQAGAATRLLRKAVDGISMETATPMVKRMVEDTNKRLALLDERMPELNDHLIQAVCSIALLIDGGELAQAANAHRELMQAGYDGELKWLLGVKRVIELQQKSTA
ncbi:hypothetical protein GQ54DRAFT_317778 [Martensiomyces pterosporus]|nr:hypothetical protein GQ54DRAFT_317778 [Martensiomyces pterosporus]